MLRLQAVEEIGALTMIPAHSVTDSLVAIKSASAWKAVHTRSLQTDCPCSAQPYGNSTFLVGKFRYEGKHYLRLCHLFYFFTNGCTVSVFIKLILAFGNHHGGNAVSDQVDDGPCFRHEAIHPQQESQSLNRNHMQRA
jgi:hypothetical protein